MTRQMLRNKGLVVAVLLLALTVSSPASALAAWGRGDRHGGHRDHYSYRDGNWHRSGWFWGSFFSGLAIGAVVASLPPYHEVIYVRGEPYYYYDGYYYRPAHNGYVVVAPPPATVVVQPAPYGSTIVVNIPNSRGGYTAVTLTRRGTGYVGPQGEYYEGNPTVDQLRALYGN